MAIGKYRINLHSYPYAHFMIICFSKMIAHGIFTKIDISVYKMRLAFFPTVRIPSIYHYSRSKAHTNKQFERVAY